MAAEQTAVRRALPPGAARRRAAFGLLDADGWTWASLKALFWFLLIIFLQGYVPDRAYYFTVSPTIDLGYNAISPINFCNPSNKTLPCPAPAGAVVPWEPNPPQLVLPQARSGPGVVTSGENVYLVGGRGASGVAIADVLATRVVNGNLADWTTGPALPEPRANAVIVSLSGVPYVIGGRDAAGNPTATVFRGTLREGALTGWEVAAELALPAPLADAAGIASTRSIYIFGGRSSDGAPSAKVWQATLGTGSSPTLGAWTENTQLPLPEARADHSAVVSGSFVYVMGGTGPSGASTSVYFLALGSDGLPKIDHDTGLPFGWGVSVGQSAGFALPEPRAKHISFTNSGAIYAVGGTAADGSLVNTVYWAVPDATTGALTGGWRHLRETDLPEPRAQAGIANVSSTAFLFGGDTPAGAGTGIYRANLSPALPFFRLGLFGMTIPALGIKGEIGQQLGYIAAGGGVATTFAVLVIIGIAYAHPKATRRFIAWITRGRFQVPPEDREPAY